MAAHPSITLGDISGVWTLNRELSDNPDELLKLQGISKPIRTILQYANVAVNISQYTQDGATHIDCSQSMGPGITGTTETRILDWTERSQRNAIFGKVTGRTRWIDSSEITDEYLAWGWEAGWVIETEVRSDKEGWHGNVIWGFANVGPNGERHYVRRAVMAKGSQVFKGTFVYDRQ